MSQAQDEFLLTKKPVPTDEQIRFFRKHPKELDIIFNRETVKLRMIGVMLTLAFVLVAGSKVVAYFYGEALDPFVSDVIVDLLFEFGAALLGGAVTVFFIEILQKRQFEENLRLRKEIEHRIALLDAQEAGSS